MRSISLTFATWLVTELVFAAPPTLPLAGDLAIPIQIQAGGRPLDVEREGHSAPEVGDFDADGVRDLLVGQYHEGRLRIYRNVGTNAEPKFEAHEWFMAGGQTGRVPEG
jgi:hypothetical protein